VARTAEELARMGHSVVVFARRWYQREVRRAGIKPFPAVRAVTVPTIPTKHLDALLHSVLCALRSAGRFDVVHFHGIGPGSAAWFVKLVEPRTPCVLTFHALDWKRDKWTPRAQRLIRILEQVAVRCADRITAVSTDLVRYVREQYAREALFIPNAVEKAVRRPPGPALARFSLEPGRYFLWVGRFVPEKGVDKLLAAFRQVPGEVKLLLAGPEHEPGFTRRIQEEASRDRRVVLAGVVTGEAIEELFSNAAAFVLPSLLEGNPLVLLEALSYGLPVIASDLPSVREAASAAPDLVSLVPPGAVDALRDRLAEELASSRRGSPEASLGTSLPTWAEVAAQIEGLYQQLADLHPRSI